MGRVVTSLEVGKGGSSWEWDTETERVYLKHPWKYPSHLTETESTTCAIIPEAERITGLYSDSSTVTAEPEKEREEEEPHLL